MSDSKPDIFRYADYRKFLEDSFRIRKERNPKFSQRFLQNKVGASSSGWFSDVVRGRINLAPHMLLRLAKVFELDKGETEFLELLAGYQQAGSAEEKEILLARIMDRREVKIDLLGEEKGEFYREWHHSAIRELLTFFRFKDDYTALARRLDPPIRPAQARESVRLLLSLELIRPDDQGFLRPSSPVVKTDGAFKSLYMNAYFKRKMLLGVQALDRFEKEHRDISCMTLSLSRDNFRKAQEEVAALRKKLLKMAEKEQHPEMVYQCNFQIFPITR